MIQASRSRSRLSARRPLPWRHRLPAGAIGLVVGEVAARSSCGWPVTVVLAAALAAPALVLRHRAAGTAALIGAGFAILGIGVAHRAALHRDLALNEPSVDAVHVDGMIRATRQRTGFGGRRALSLDVEIRSTSPAQARVRRGEIVRLAVWDVRGKWAAGEAVRFRAPLRRPRGLCNTGEDRYAERLWREGVTWVASMRDDRTLEAGGGFSGAGAVLLRARAGTSAAIDARLAAPEAAVLRALVVGDRGGLPDDLRRAFARTGTAHVLSVSGLHMAIVTGTAFRAARAFLVRCPAFALRLVAGRAAALVALLAAATYAAFSGGAVATVRSLAMAAVYLVGIAWSRPPDLFVAIAAAALWVCAADPGAPFDRSFQLSFAAVLAIVGGMRLIESGGLGWLVRPPAGARGMRRALGLAAATVCVSASAAVGTAPFTAAHFGMVPVLGSLANLAVVPLVGWLALLAGLVGAVLRPLSEGLAGTMFAAAGRAIAVAEVIVVRIAAVPGAALRVQPSTLEAASWGAALLGLALPGFRPRVLACGLGVAAAVATAFLDGSGLGEPRLRLALLDVGQGDAAVIEVADRGAVAVDAGPLPVGGGSGPGTIAAALRARGIRKLDALALSHPQADHYGGIESLLGDIDVAEFWSSGATAPTRSFASVGRALSRAGVERRAFSAGDRPLLRGRGEVVDVLHPEKSVPCSSRNDDSLVLTFRYGATRVLFSGDLEAGGERVLLAAGRDLGATVLKVPHHGSRTSSTDTLLSAVRPSLALAGVGARNRFGFPAAEVRARYARYGALWRETGRSGEILVVSDGQLATVSTCRGGLGR
jgi:competence protein ComEC